MIPYGKKKGGSSKIHPHNECGVCSEASDNIIKKRGRKGSKVVKPGDGATAETLYMEDGFILCDDYRKVLHWDCPNCYVGTITQGGTKCGHCGVSVRYKEK